MAFDLATAKPMDAGGGFDLSTAKPVQTEKSLAARIDEKLKTAPRDLVAGAVKGAANIGSTLLMPLDYVKDKITGKTAPTLSGLVTGEKPKTSNQERREGVTEALRTLGAEPESIPFKAGELGSEVAGTAGAGGVIAKIPMLVKYAPRLAAAIESGGFKLGGAPAKTAAETVKNAVTRTAGGAITGGASAGLVNPDDAAAGAVIGGAMPGAVKVAGAAGKALASEISPEVAALYQKAKNLGIDIPADRIANSKPLNAVAASLNYVPFSGRAGTEQRMVSQMDRALSRTFGQDSPNVTQALRRAQQSLGDKFENTLKNNTLKVDNDFMNDLVGHLDTAHKELGEEGAKIIGNQIDAILNKAGATGEIDGQAAYNIKKSLDRIAGRNSNEAFYANELKKSLMGALNRSLGPDEAAKFALVRKQYGNMLDVARIAQNGAEGGVSVGRLANMKDIGNNDLQDLADIAAQFLKSRENPHGAAQRVVLGSLGLGAAHATGTLPVLAGGVVAARAANTALNSEAAKKLLLNQGAIVSKAREIAANKPLRALVYNSAVRSNP